MEATGHKVKCPDCGSEMVLRQSRFKYPDGTRRRFWGCSEFPRCRGSHGAHPDGRPLGVPLSARDKAFRIETHDAMDRWMDRAGVDRRTAYSILSNRLGFELHIGELDAVECQALTELLNSLR